MGTRSLTIMMDGDTEIAVLYRQFDGYPTGAGADIKRILGNRSTVNGYSSSNQINGAGCMAVQLIATLKAAGRDGTNSPGGYHLYPAGTRDCGQDYTYTLTYKGEGERISLKIDDGKLYDGPLDDFDPEAAENFDD